MRSGDKGHRGCKGHQERNQVPQRWRRQIRLTNSGESGWSPWPENLVLAGRPHLRMESEAAPLPVSCQGWTRQGLVGKDQSPLPTGLPGLPFPLLSPAAPVLLQPRLLRKRARCLHLPVGGGTLKAHHSEIQEYSSSHWPSPPAAISGGLYTHVGAVLRLQLEFVAETEEILTMNLPSLPTFQHGGRQPREKQQGEEETGNPSHIPTPRRPADRHIPLGSPGPDIGGSLGTLNLQQLMWISLQA